MEARAEPTINSSIATKPEKVNLDLGSDIHNIEAAAQLLRKSLDKKYYNGS